MADQFDPYYVWLGIPPRDQPPNHYRLLGLEAFEENLDVIDAATNRQTSYLHEMASGPNRKYSQDLLNEIASARACLLDSDRKKKYDAKLRKKLDENTAAAAAPAAAPAPVPAPPADEAAPPDETADKDKAPAADTPVADSSVADSSVAATDGTVSPALTDDETKQSTASSDTSDSDTAAKKETRSDSKGKTESKSGTKSKGKKAAKKPDTNSPPDEPVESEAPARKQSSWIMPAGIGGGVVVMAIVLFVVLGGDDDPTPESPGGTQTTQKDDDPPKDGQPGEQNPETDTVGSMLLMPGVHSDSPDGTTPEMDVEGLLANWRFDEKSDAMAVDSGGGNRNATYQGKPVFVSGPFGSAVRLNGASDQVVVPASAFNEAQGTLAFWVRREADGKAQPLADTSGGRYLLSLDAAGTLTAGIGNGAQVQTIESTVSLDKDVWYHIALSWTSGGPVSVFCNAEAVGKLDKVGKLTPPTKVVLGSSNDAKNFASVTLDDVRLFARALAKPDLQKLLKDASVAIKVPKPAGPPTPAMDFSADKDGMVVRYQFPDAQKVAVDSRDQQSATNHGATVVDDATLGEKVLNLDGKDDWLELPGNIVQSDFMMTFWMKTSQPGPPTPDWKAGNRVMHAGDGQFGISVVDDRLVFGTGGKGSQPAFSRTIINDGQWHFIAAKRKADDGKLELLVDGRKESGENVVAQTGPLNATKIAVGRSVDKADKFFAGQLADLRVYSRLDTPNAEITEKIGGERWKSFDASRPKPPPASAIPLPTEAATGTIHHRIYTELAAKSLKPLREAMRPLEGGGKRAAVTAMAERRALQIWLNKDCANTGRRVTGFLIPPLDGRYRFSTRISDHGTFRVSTSSTADGLMPVNDGIELTANRLHFFELLYKCDDNNGGYTISWILPNGAQESPIPGHRFGWSPHQSNFVTLPVAGTPVSDKDNKFTADGAGGFLVDGTRKGSTYEVDVKCLVNQYTAFRLDALVDATDTILAGGPGLGSKGAFEVAEFSVSVQEPGQQPVPIAQDRFDEAIADTGIPKYGADNKPTTVWGQREGGTGASLVLPLKNPWFIKPGTILKFRIVCDDNLGKFRISGTSATSDRLGKLLSNYSTAPVRKTAGNRIALYVNMGPSDEEVRRQVYKKARPWNDKKPDWGYVGGSVVAANSASPNSDPITNTCVAGLTEFRVKVTATDTYEVKLTFCENWQQDPTKRQFEVQIGTNPKVPVNPRGRPATLTQLVKMEAGKVLHIRFTKQNGKDPPILNAVSVVQK